MDELLALALSEEDKDDNQKQAGSDASNRSAGSGLRQSKRDCRKPDQFKSGA